MGLEKELTIFCRRCGRKLKTHDAKERGMGKICWEKSHQPNLTTALFVQSLNKEQENG